MSEYNKTALVLGAGGFIGSHMVKRLREEGYWVRGVDLKKPEYGESRANEFVHGDLRDVSFVRRVLGFKGYLGNFYASVPEKYIEPFDEIYQFAADMGGAGFVFTGENDVLIMHNSVSINLNVLEEQRKLNDRYGVNRTKIFFTLDLHVCTQSIINLIQITPIVVKNPHIQQIQTQNMDGKNCSQSVSTLLTIVTMGCLSGLLAITIFSLKELGKVEERRHQPAICRKVADLAPIGGSIEVWGDGLQTRSFLYIDECIEATRRLMGSDFIGSVNIGSEEMVTINELVDTAARVSGKTVEKIYKLDAPTGVRGRNSNNDLIREKLGWDYSQSLEEGIRKTYTWIARQVANR